MSKITVKQLPYKLISETRISLLRGREAKYHTSRARKVAISEPLGVTNPSIFNILLLTLGSNRWLLLTDIVV